MTDIIVIENGRELSEYIARIMSRNYFVRYFDGSRLTERGKGYMLDILSASEISQVSCQGGAVILGRGAFLDISAIHGKFTFIVESSQSEQIAALSRCSFPVMTCGAFEKDTVSYTSISDENITVSLNRNITALSGRNVQPLELPVSLMHGREIYFTLAATALRILLDDFDSELGKLY